MKFIEKNILKKILYYIILFFMIIGSINNLIADSPIGYNFIDKINLLFENGANKTFQFNTIIYIIASLSAIIFHIIRIFFVLKIVE
jgi:hypothetical protein